MKKLKDTVIKQIKEMSKETGFTYQAIKKWRDKAMTKSSLTERNIELERLIKAAKERRMSKGCKHVSIYNDGLLMALFKWKQEYEWGNADVLATHQYKIVVGDEVLKFDYGEVGERTKFEGFDFGSCFFVMSAIYSLVTEKKPDSNGMFKISLKNVYEFIHRNGRWDRTTIEERKKLYNDILNMSYAFRKIHGEYISKEVKKAPVEKDFFLYCDKYSEESPEVMKKELEKNESEGYKEAVLYFRYPQFLEMCHRRKQITTIPEDMLKLETEHVLDGIKYYVAWWIRVADNSNSISPTIRYDTLKILFGGDHRKMVKRYAKFLEEKGFIKNLRFEHDAMRWNKVKRSKDNGNE